MKDCQENSVSGSVEVLRCGIRPTMPSILFHRDVSETPVDVQFQCWCVRSGDRTVLIDAGLPSGDRRLIPIKEAKTTKTLLAEGLEALTVTDVIVTHLHWDHAGDLELFPDAAIHIQALELEFVRSLLFSRRAVRELFINQEKLEWLLENQNVRALSKEDEIAPSISVRWVGGHTPGSQLVLVKANSAEYVFTGDVVNKYQNLSDDKPPGIIWSMDEALVALDTVRSLQSAGKTIVPGHELVASIRSFEPCRSS